MKLKSTLRSFLCIAGSSLLAVSSSSAQTTYYWDSNDGAAGFGNTAGTWATPTTGTTTRGWSTDSTGATAIDGNSVSTTIADDVFLGTAAIPYTGAITISGTVNAKRIFKSATTAMGGTGATINFAAEGIYEIVSSNTTFPGATGIAVTGAGTSLTYKGPPGTLNTLNVTTLVNNTANSTIIQDGARLAVSSTDQLTGAKQLGPDGSALVFDGGALRTLTGFNYSSVTALSVDHPVTFNINRNAGFDNFIANSTFDVDVPLNLGSGFYNSNGQGNAIVRLSQTNIMAGVNLGSGTLEISQSSNLGPEATSTLQFGSGTSSGAGGGLRITGTAMTSFGARTVTTQDTKLVTLDIVDAANTFTCGIPLTQGAGVFTKAGIGTLVLNQNNTFTGASSISGGALVLDYTSNNGNKLSDTSALTIASSDLTLKNGSHAETVLSTTLNAGHSHIARDGGSSSINLNAITPRPANNFGTLSFSADSIATTDRTNTNGVLGGWATVGSNWAKNFSNALDGEIRALVPGDYTAFVTTGGVNTTNYQLTGGATLAGAVVSNSVRIENSADDQILDLGSVSLRCNTNGGFLYAGGSNNKYTINGTGALRNADNTETIIHTAAGTLTVSAQVSHGTGPLTKSGAGTLVLGAANAYTGNTLVNQGTLRVNGVIATAGATMTVFNKATLGGTGTIGVSTTVNSGGKLEFDISTPAGSHDKLDLAATKSLTFGGVSTLTINSTSGAAIGDYVLVSAPGGIIGSVPATLNLPAGWAATVTKENSNQDLVLKVTSVGAVATAYDTWATAKGLTGLPGSSTDPAKDADPDKDGRNNLGEFAFNGNPLSGSDNGLIAGLVQDASAPAGNEQTLVVAVRDGADFDPVGSPVVQSDSVDGVTYTIEGTLDLATIPGSAVSQVSGPSNTAPAATGLPDLTGTAWEYHTFKLDASEGLTGKGFLRAKVTSP